jgi:hypothetical protein
MPDRYVSPLRRFGLRMSAVSQVRSRGWVLPTPGGVTTTGRAAVSWGDHRVVSLVLAGATLVTGLMTLALAPASAASVAAAPTTAYVVNSSNVSGGNSVTPSHRRPCTCDAATCSAG